MSKTIRFLALALAFVWAGCSDDGGSEPNPSIAVSLGGAITVVQGQTGTTQVTVTRGGGFSGAVSLTATNLPAGVTAAFDPATIPAGSGNGTSTLTLTAGPNAPTGAGTFVVTASGGATLTATANGNVTVSPAPDFSLNVTPNVAVLDQGGTTVLNVAIARTGGFTGAVNLTLANLPTGVTAGFDNAAPTGATAVLTLTADANAALGPTNVTVNGSGTPGNRSAQFALTIQTPPGSFTLEADPETVSIVQGEDGQVTVLVSKTGSFTGAVALTVTGLPAGVVATFDPANASAAMAARDEQVTSTLTLTVSAGAATGDHPLVIRGNAEGQTEKTANLTLTITPAAGGGGYSLLVDPNALTIEQGTDQQATVTIDKTGTFTGDVTLSVTGLPAGVTATFTPPQASPAAQGTRDVQTTSTLTLAVGSGVAAQAYPLVIHGTAEGQEERVTNLSLTVTAAPVGGFTIALDPAALSIEAGQDGQATVNINKTGPFTQNVALSVTNLPVGITAAFNPVAASPGKSPGKSPSKATDAQTQSTLTLTVANTVAAQEYDLNVRGSFEGLPDQDATLTLTVTPAPGGYTLESNPSTVNVQVGQSGQTTILVKKTGSFTGNVTLSVTGLPANVTASFNPASASPRRASSARDVTTESVLTLNVGGSAAVNNYPLVVHGAAEGQDEQTVAVNLNVTPGGGGSGNATIKFCPPGDLPIWFAYRDGPGGAWTQVTGVAEGDGTRYTYDLNQSTGAIAWVSGSASEGYQTTVTYGTQAQLIGNGGQCPTSPFTRTLNGSVSGIDPTDFVLIAMGGAGTNVLPFQPNFQLERVLDGPADLLAVRGQASAEGLSPIGIILRPGVNVPHNGTIPVLNFATEAFAAVTAPITVNGQGSDPFLGVNMSFMTPTTTGTIMSAFNPNSLNPIPMGGVPNDKHTGASDLHQLNVNAFNNAGESRNHTTWYKTVAAKTVNLGPVLTAPTVTSLGNSPYPRYQSTGPIQAIYDDLFSFSMTQVNGTDADFRGWNIIAFGGFFAGANYTMTIEDLTGAGYQTAWALKVGVETDYQMQGAGYSPSGIADPRIEGGTSDAASRTGQVTP